MIAKNDAPQQLKLYDKRQTVKRISLIIYIRLNYYRII